MCDGNAQSVGLWDERDRKKSSTFRELIKAILFAMQSFCSHLYTRESDSFLQQPDQNAVRIIHVGSPVTELQSIVVTIFQLYLYGGSVDS